jgi:hypothetical protein
MNGCVGHETVLATRTRQRRAADLALRERSARFGLVAVVTTIRSWNTYEEGATMSTAMAKLNRTIEDLTLEIKQEIHVKAPLEKTFSALLEQLGPRNERLDGTPMPLKLEAWPGGRWYRDLGDGNGHLWAHVQAIKKPTLLEFYGPLFMSYPVSSNLQYRLKEHDGGTLIEFRHTALGLITEEHRTGVVTGWGHVHEMVQKLAEGRLKAH